MTRINTNVSSLNAQKSLARSNRDLQQSLTRLSTGLRINSGKDDPAGLIASETLRSDMVATSAAINNSERANQVIATADSALGQVSSLLNDIRGLITEAANEGAISQEEIEANQLQVDSALSSINQIAQVTQFGGKRLLDGSLDFITEDVTSTELSGVQINQANFGTQDQIGVSVNVATQATKAQLTHTGSTLTSDVVLELGGAKGFTSLSFGVGTSVTDMATAINLVSDSLGIEATLADRVAETATHGEVSFANTGGAAADSFTVTAATAGQYAGNYTIRMTKGAAGAATSAAWSAGSPNVIDVTVGTAAAATAAARVAGPYTLGGAGTFDTLAADLAGEEYNEVNIEITQGTDETARYDYATHTIKVNTDVAGGNDMSDLAALINGQLGNLFTFTANADDTIAAGSYTNGGNGFTDDTGATAGTVTATVQQVRDQIHALSQVDASVNTSASVVDVITHAGTIGEVNDSETTSSSEPNNMIQLTTTGGAANVSVVFRAAGASQTFGIEYTNNTRTDGKAIAYLQDGAGVLQVQAVQQGTEWNDVTINVVDHATQQNATYDASTKTLTVYGDVSGPGTETTADLVERINATGLFTATALVDGAIDDGTTGTTADGAIYDGITINLATDANGLVTSTAAEVVDAINAATAMQAAGITASHVFSSDGSGTAATGTLTLSAQGITATNAYATGTTYNTDATDGTLTVAATTAGSAYDNVKIVFADDGTVGSEYATYDSAEKILTFHVDSGVSTALAVATAFANGSLTSSTVKSLFTVNYNGTGGSAVTTADVGWLRGGVTYSGTSLGGLDSDGNFDAGQVVGTSGLNITSTEYGSDQFVSVEAISGTFSTVNTAGVASTRESGTDIIARINGILAVGNGLQATIKTAALDMSIWVDADVAAGTTSTFAITGGGAQFQLGPDVVSNQQARIGIASVSTTSLGANSGYGRLYEVGTGNEHSLLTDTAGAANIVDSVITEITTLRGRLGAFQATTLETNIDALTDTYETLTDAESTIRDADFASETSALTRAQILQQSGISVLSIANQSPQNVLALLQ